MIHERADVANQVEGGGHVLRRGKVFMIPNTFLYVGPVTKEEQRTSSTTSDERILHVDVPTSSYQPIIGPCTYILR